MAQDMDQNAWSTRLALSIAREVRRHRTRLGLSAAQLSARCGLIGMPIQRSVLANLESGRRTTVTVAEVLVLARALNVPPGALIFPAGYEQMVETLPGAWAEPGFSVEWLSGRSFLDAEAAEDFFDSPLGLIRLHHDTAVTLRRAIRARDHARLEFAEAAERHEQESRAYNESRFHLQEVNQRLATFYDAQSSSMTPEAQNEYLQLSRMQAELDHQIATMRGGAQQFMYAQQKVDSLEQKVAASEASLRKYRDTIKSQGLIPPVLEEALSYIDPEASTESAPSRNDLPSLSIDQGDDTPDVRIGDVRRANEEDAESGRSERVREIMEELRPLILESVSDVLEKVLRERD